MPVVPLSTMLDLRPPTILESPSNIDADLVSAVNLTCTVEGSPAPSYQWCKDGAAIPGETRAYLYIEETVPDDRGNYTCVANNTGGRVESQPARLTIHGIFQYAITLSGSGISEVQNLIAGSSLLDTRFTIYSAQVLYQESAARNVTLLVTIHEAPLMSSASVAARRRSLLTHLNTIPSIEVQGMVRFDGCEPERFRRREWSETDLGDFASSECPCVEFLDSLAGRALRFCGGVTAGGAQWSEEIDTSMCVAVTSDTTSQLCRAVVSVQNSLTAPEVSALVVNITSNPEMLTEADISAISFVVESLTDEALINPEVRSEYLEIVDNIQQADPDVVYNSQVMTGSSKKILDNLAKLSDMLDLTTSDNSSEDNKAVFSFDTYALQLQDIDPILFNGQTFTVDLGSVEDAMKSTRDIDDSLMTSEMVMEILENSTASVQLPDDFLDSVQGCTSDAVLRLSYSVFLIDILFQSPQTRTNADIGSIIVAVRLGCAEDTTSFNPIRVVLRTIKQVNITKVDRRRCAIWKPETGTWSASGCSEVMDGGNQTVCECKQLGHFAILLDLNPGGPMDPAVTLALFIITYIGISLSLLCLAALTCTYLSSKKLRRDTHSQIILNMSVSLAGLYIFFLIGGHVTGFPVLCGFSAALLHYFMLVFFSWTAVEAIWLYLKLVKVFGTLSAESLYIVKSGVPTWVIPLLIVMLSAGPGYKYYISSYYCRATEWPFWLGFIAPFILLYVFDWIMFIIIITSLMKRRSASNKMKSSSNSKLYKENLFIALSLAVVFGLGWGFGLLATSYPVEEITITFQVLFSIFVGAQGLLLFLLHGVRNSDARRVWKGWATSIIGTSKFSSRKSAARMQHSASTSQNSTLPQTLDLPELGQGPLPAEKLLADSVLCMLPKLGEAKIPAKKPLALLPEIGQGTLPGGNLLAVVTRR